MDWFDGFLENRVVSKLVRLVNGSFINPATGLAVTVPVYAWGAGFPAAGSLVAGSVVGVSPASFGGTGKSTLPIYLISDGASFRPYGRQLLCRANGTKAAPISGVASNIVASNFCKFSQGTSYSVPANFLASGWNIGVQATGFRGTTVAGTAILRAIITTVDAMAGGTTNPLVQSTIAATSGGAWSINTAGGIGPGEVLVRDDVTAKIGLLNGGSADSTMTLSSVNYFLIGVSSATNGDDFALVNYSFYIE